MPTRLILADDHPLLVRGIEQLLEAEADFQVVATCPNGEAALEAVREHRPDLLVLDLRLPDKDGLEVLQQLKRERLSTRVVLLTASIDEEELLRAVRLGAAGIVLKDTPPPLLLTCLRKVRGGGKWIELESLLQALDSVVKREAGGRAAAAQLTPREIEIVRLAARGLRNAEIGERLFISEGTVKIHLHNVYEKLRIERRIELVLYAQEKGLA